ncbi:MAG: hypothetical protein LW875_08465 [Proteobacteria bacterium]|jgi:hypothetical protein|nr:hypothetical protein [Pseudomonadota bacterium]
MEKISRLLWSQIQRFQIKLQSLLEPKTLTPHLRLEESSFEVSSDINQLEYLGDDLPQDPQERWVVTFSRLNAFFEAGMMLSKYQEKKWVAVAAFRQGKFFPLSLEDAEIVFPFPDMGTHEVRQVTQETFRKNLATFGLIKNEETRILTLAPQPGIIYLFTSEMPDPWLKTVISAVHRELSSIYRRDQ